MGDVVARDDEVLAEVVLAAQHNMGVGVLRVEMIGGDPIELGPEIFLHPAHEITHEGLQIFKLGCVFRRHDESELVAVAFAAVEKRPAVGLVARRVVEPARLVLFRDAIALDVIEMRARRCDSAALELDDARLDDNAARGRAEAMARTALAHGRPAAPNPVA